MKFLVPHGLAHPILLHSNTHLYELSGTHGLALPIKLYSNTHSYEISITSWTGPPYFTVFKYTFIHNFMYLMDWPTLFYCIQLHIYMNFLVPHGLAHPILLYSNIHLDEISVTSWTGPSYFIVFKYTFI